ncbi:hypothetical protein HanPI659440_Chr09g0356571 [Helianthus annuus]|nr:hypothetical protein HanPI659440_Chr09g0356571 [Helianthus annuus]
MVLHIVIQCLYGVISSYIIKEKLSRTRVLTSSLLLLLSTCQALPLLTRHLLSPAFQTQLCLIQNSNSLSRSPKP